MAQWFRSGGGGRFLAAQFTGFRDNIVDCCSFVKEARTYHFSDTDHGLMIVTPMGEVPVHGGYWIVKNAEGLFITVYPDAKFRELFTLEKDPTMPARPETPEERNKRARGLRAKATYQLGVLTGLLHEELGRIQQVRDSLCSEAMTDAQVCSQGILLQKELASRDPRAYEQARSATLSALGELDWAKEPQ